ncbi:MAG: hypothetical protein JOY71_03720 [Acetobacteraceae bacterium]|nr:hypothetical protein [Acetobacteraceae bacterium]
MPKQSTRQKEIVGRVMHEFKHGELETGAGKKIRNPRQAIAIGLSEAGASKYQSPAEKRRSRARTERKERASRTAQQQKEGNGDRRASRGRGLTRAELYAEAKRRGMRGCSRLSKGELERALKRRG